jgi:hypothetical protein
VIAFLDFLTQRRVLCASFDIIFSSAIFFISSFAPRLLHLSQKKHIFCYYSSETPVAVIHNVLRISFQIHYHWGYGCRQILPSSAIY